MSKNDTLKMNLKKCKKDSSNSIFMLEQFPYFIVGNVIDIFDDCISVKAKFGVSDELLDTIFYINLLDIVAFHYDNE